MYECMYKFHNSKWIYILSSFNHIIRFYTHTYIHSSTHIHTSPLLVCGCDRIYIYIYIYYIYIHLTILQEFPFRLLFLIWSDFTHSHVHTHTHAATLPPSLMYVCECYYIYIYIYIYIYVFREREREREKGAGWMKSWLDLNLVNIRTVFQICWWFAEISKLIFSSINLAFKTWFSCVVIIDAIAVVTKWTDSEIETK